MTEEAKASKTLIGIHFLLRSEILGANIRVMFHKVPITSAKTFACPTWEFAAGTCP
jgi:hypothetical protein